MTYAIYMEFSDDDSVFQQLFIPATPFGTETLSPRLAHRQLSIQHPSRVWNVVPDPNYAPSSRQAHSVIEMFGHELQQISALSSYMTSSMSDPSWELVGFFPILVNDSDKLAMREHPTRVPTRLSAEIRSTRNSKGWSALPERA